VGSAFSILMTLGAFGRSHPCDLDVLITKLQTAFSQTQKSLIFIVMFLTKHVTLFRVSGWYQRRCVTVNRVRFAGVRRLHFQRFIWSDAGKCELM
jgi:hypothetical protein